MRLAPTCSIEHLFGTLGLAYFLSQTHKLGVEVLVTPTSSATCLVEDIRGQGIQMFVEENV